jgi:hypothetical protein
VASSNGVGGRITGDRRAQKKPPADKGFPTTFEIRHDEAQAGSISNVGGDQTINVSYEQERRVWLRLTALLALLSQLVFVGLLGYLLWRLFTDRSVGLALVVALVVSVVVTFFGYAVRRLFQAV